MDVIHLLVYFLIFVCVVCFAIWVVRQTIPAGQPQTIGLATVGIVALIVLLLFFTDLGHFRL